MTWETLLTNLLIGVATAVVAALGKAINDWNTRQKEAAELAKEWSAKDDAAEVLTNAIAQTGVDFVQDLKIAVADGRLSKNDIKEARDKAYVTAMNNAVGPALTWLKEHTKDAIEAMIDGIVQRGK